MATDLVAMDYQQLVGAFADTADVIRSVYLMLYQATGKAGYSTKAQAACPWDPVIGYADELDTMLGDLMTEMGGSGGGGNSDLDISNIFAKARAGSFTLAEDMTSGTYTINHGLGGEPDAILLFSQLPLETGASDIEPTIAYAAYIKNTSSSTYRSITIRLRPGQAVSSLAGASGGPGFVANNVTASSFGITCTAGGGLRGGMSYDWVALKRKGGAG